MNSTIFSLKCCLREYWKSVDGGRGRGKLTDAVIESIHSLPLLWGQASWEVYLGNVNFGGNHFEGLNK